MTMLTKKEMSEKDIKLQYITPTILAKWEKSRITMEMQITDGNPNASATVSYSLEKLFDMALKDYEQKNGVRPENAEAVITKDGSVTIQLSDAHGGHISMADYYTQK